LRFPFAFLASMSDMAILIYRRASGRASDESSRSWRRIPGNNRMVENCWFDWHLAAQSKVGAKVG
jgi:hypothetical protein